MGTRQPSGDFDYNLTFSSYEKNNFTLGVFLTGNDTSEASQLSEMVRAINLFGVVLGVASIVLNLVFLVAMRFLKERSTAYNTLMWNLSIADLMASLLFLLTRHFPSGPFAYMTEANDFILHEGLPYIFRSMPWMFFTGYLFTLTCLTVHQYVAVCKPWKYSKLVTRKIMRLSLVLVWGLSSLQVIIPSVVLLGLAAFSDKTAAKVGLYYVSRVEMQIWMAIFAVTTLFNIILDIIIYRKIKVLKLKHMKHPGTNQQTMNIKMKQEAFITVTLLLTASLFCRLPFPLFSIVGLELATSGKIIAATGYLINSIIVFLLFLNFFADPIVYMCRMKEVRIAFKYMTGHCTSPCSMRRNRSDRRRRSALSKRCLSIHNR